MEFPSEYAQPRGANGSRDGLSPEHVVRLPKEGDQQVHVRQPDVLLPSREKTQGSMEHGLKKVRLPAAEPGEWQVRVAHEGRKTQPIWGLKTEHDYPDAEDRPHVPAEHTVVEPVDGTGRGRQGIRGRWGRYVRRNDRGPASVSRCSVWSKNSIPSVPEMPKITTLNRRING